MKTRTVNIIGVMVLLVSLSAFVFVMCNPQTSYADIYNKTKVEGERQAKEFVDSVYNVD